MTSPAYTLYSKASEIRERLAYILELLVPQVLPTQLFTRLHPDNLSAGSPDLYAITASGRWRMFRIRVGSYVIAPGTAWGSDKFWYQAEFRVEVGYPPDAFVFDEAAVPYDVDDLQAHDFEEIDREVVAENPFRELDAEHLVIEDVKVPVLTGSFFDGRVRRTTYKIDFARTW